MTLTLSLLTPLSRIGGVEVWLHTLLLLALEGDGQTQVAATLPQGNDFPAESD